MLNYKFNLEPSPVDERDYLLESIYPVRVDLPEVWDMRTKLPPVRDQGEQGSCSAQSAAVMKEWQESVDVGFVGHMSPQFVYNLRFNQTSEGMTPRDTMMILNKIGIVAESDYKYGTLRKPNKDVIERAARFRIAGYAQINTIDSLKKALYANGPCYIAFSVYNPQNPEFWKQEFPNQRSLGGHAVAVVGWLKDSFIIRNSWSSEWGDGGYSYFKFSDWGTQWECWTTIDEDSNPETLKKKVESRKKDKGWFRALFAKKMKK